jgi:hypothetical protein
MLCINFDKIWVGLHFGSYFTNSSGRPADREKCLGPEDPGSSPARVESFEDLGNELCWWKL